MRDWTTETARYVENLVTVYTMSTREEIAAGKKWYPNARRFAQELAKRHGVTLNVAAGVIAALSPGAEWERNKANADGFLLAYRDCSACALDRLTFSTYGKAPIAKALAIVEGAPIARTLHGYKTTAFYRAIVAPRNTRDVVIDGHAKSAALGVRVGSHAVRVEPNEYPHFEAAYRAAAGVVGLLPNELQAVIWLVWKRIPVGYTVIPITRRAA